MSPATAGLIGSS